MASTEKQLSSNNLLIILALVTLLVLGVTALATKAMIASIILNNKVLTAKNLASKNLDTDLSAAPNLVNSYNSLGSQAGELADALPTTTDFPALIVELENISNSSGVSLKSVGPDVANSSAGATAGASSATSTSATPVTSNSPTSVSAVSSSSNGGIQKPSPQTYAFTMSVDGQYTSLLKVLGDLETSARPMRVIGMQATGSGPQMSVNLNVQTYYMDKAQLPIGKETVK